MKRREFNPTPFLPETQYHIIQQHVFEIDFSAKERASLLQARVSKIFNATIYADIDAVFSSLSQPGSVIKIDTLEIDLGHIAENELETALPAALTNALKEALYNYQRNKGFPNNKSFGKNDVITASQALAHYLHSGTMPWWVTGPYANPYLAMEHLLSANEPQMLDVLLNTGGKEDIMARIAQQYPEPVITAIITLLLKANAAFVLTFQKQICALQQSKQLIKTTSNDFKIKVYQFILTWIITEYGSNFNEKMFVKNNLQSTANYFNISYQALLLLFFEANEYTKKLGPGYNHLTAIITDLYYEINTAKKHQLTHFTTPTDTSQKKEITTEKKYAQILSFYFTNGSVPWWANKESKASLDEMLQFLLQNNLPLANSVFIKTGHFTITAKNFTANFSEDNIKQAVGLLNPAQAQFIINLHFYILHKCAGHSQINGKPNWFSVKIWEFIFTFLLTNYNKAFTTDMFLSSILTGLANHLGVSVNNLLNAISATKEIQIPGIKYTPALDGLITNFKKNIATAYIANQHLIPAEAVKPAESMAGDMLTHFTLHGLMPWAAYTQQNQPSPDKLLQQLLDTNKTNALYLFKIAGTNKKAREAWVNNVSFTALQKIIYLLPLGAEALETGDIFAKIVQQQLTNSFTTPAANNLLIKVLWQHYHTYDYTYINLKEFMLQYLTSIAFVLNIPQAAFLKKIYPIIAAHYFNINQTSFINNFTVYISNHLKTEEAAKEDTSNAITGSVTNFTFSHQKQYDVNFITGITANNIHLPAAAEGVILTQALKDDIERVVTFFLQHNQLPVEYDWYKTPSVLQYFLSKPEEEIIPILNNILSKPVFQPALLHAFHIASYQSYKTSVVNLLNSHINNIEAPFDTHKTARAPQNLISADYDTDILVENQLIAAVAYNDIGAYIQYSNNTVPPDTTAAQVAETILKNYLYNNTLPQDIEKLSTFAINIFLTKLLIFLMHKKPSALYMILQKNEHIAANGIRLHYLFNKGVDIEQRAVLSVLNNFIEHDILRVLTPAASHNNKSRTLKDFFDEWRNYADSKPAKLHTLISQTPTLAYYLHPYLYEQEMIELTALNNHSSNALQWVQPIQAMLSSLVLPGAVITEIEQQFTFYTTGIKDALLPVSSFTQFTASFLSHLDKHNTKLLTHLYPALLNMADKHGTVNPFIKNELEAFKQMLLQGMAIHKNNTLLKMPVLQQQTQPALIKPVASNQQQAIVTPEPKKIVYPKLLQEDAASYYQKMYIANAGIVLLHPFISVYFSRLLLVQNGQFVTAEARQRAAHLLQYVAFGTTQHPEYMLPLNKILCNIPLQQPIDSIIEVTETEEDVTEQLFGAVKQQWSKLHNTSVEGVRQSFLQREGILTQAEDGWNLRVDQKAYDIILQTLPWGLSLVKFAWMDKILNVEWA
jgi:hypothetical protein